MTAMVKWKEGKDYLHPELGKVTLIQKNGSNVYLKDVINENVHILNAKDELQKLREFTKRENPESLINYPTEWTYHLFNTFNGSAMNILHGTDGINGLFEKFKRDEGVWDGALNNKIRKQIDPRNIGRIGLELYCSLMECDTETSFYPEKSVSNNYLTLGSANYIKINFDTIQHSGRIKAVKTATMVKYGEMKFNQIRKEQTWDDLIFVCIFPEEVEIYEITRGAFEKYIVDHPDEQTWIGGKQRKEKLNNDITQNDAYQWWSYYPFDLNVFRKIYPRSE